MLGLCLQENLFTLQKEVDNSTLSNTCWLPKFQVIISLLYIFPLNCYLHGCSAIMIPRYQILIGYSSMFYQNTLLRRG
ncbi:hypothetical protein BJX61DRAFT_507422 [Aspergillus egyptiacus]|nr:hypothetical protein BJX61DRAFT_507422 [Aspergillus egyptiacus]